MDGKTLSDDVAYLVADVAGMCAAISNLPPHRADKDVIGRIREEWRKHIAKCKSPENAHVSEIRAQIVIALKICIETLERANAADCN